MRGCLKVWGMGKFERSRCKKRFRVSVSEQRKSKTGKSGWLNPLWTPLGVEMDSELVGRGVSGRRSEWRGQGFLCDGWGLGPALRHWRMRDWTGYRDWVGGV